MKPPFRCLGRLRNIALNRNKHPAVLRDEDLCFYVPMWFKNSEGLVIPVGT